MTFFEAIQTVLSKYTTFSGRASRPEIWWWTLFVVLLHISIGIVDGALPEVTWGYAPRVEMMGGPLSLTTSMVLLLPNLSVSVRRLHDIDRSGWWILILLIPIIGALVLLYWMTRTGTDSANRFGVPQSAARPDAHY